MNSTTTVAERAEGLRHWFALYGLPIMVAIATLAGLFVSSLGASGVGKTLSFPVREVRSDAYTPEMALAELQRLPHVASAETNRSESPFWVLLTIRNPSSRERTEVEFPSKHVRSIDCWSGDDLQPLGSADRAYTAGEMRLARAGFALGLPFPDTPASVLCKLTHRGPARISALQWTASELDFAIAETNRTHGLLEGGLLTLAVFMFVAALINREWIYVLFAAWLVANLRLGLISTGWDTTWLGVDIPLDANEVIRKATVPIYYILTFALFGELFKTELQRLGKQRFLTFSQWLGLLLLVISLTQPVVRFLPLMWAIVAWGIVVLVFYLGWVLIRTRSRVAWWYTASLFVVMLSSMSEVIGAAFGLRAVMPAFNSVSAALLSSLIAAFAIAEQLRAERAERRQAEAELRLVYNSTPVGLFSVDFEGELLRANPAMERLLGQTVGGGPEAPKVHWELYFGPGSLANLRGVAERETDLQLSPETGVLAGKTLLARASLVEGRIEGSLQDITERAQAQRRLVYLAEHDALTGIANRRAIEAVLEKTIADTNLAGSIALAYLDLDRFKLINDLFGHQAGDAVLRQVCARCSAVLGSQHPMGRVGGDEFVIVFRGIRVVEATALARAVITVIGGEPYQVGARAFQVNGSIGLIEVDGRLGCDEAISTADRACREAKRSLEHLTVYETNAPAFQERQEELRIIEDLGNQSDDMKGLFLEMQPIMSLATPHAVKDFEILLRVCGPDGNLIPAHKVIPVAEQHGFIARIDRWVLRTALEWMSQNEAGLTNTRFICVNLSGGSLNDERFINDTFELLARYRSVLPRLCIEVTESVALHDLENTVRFIEGLRRFGAKVALDDFGAGYTSFSYLKALSADAIKIDGSFIKNLSTHPADVSIVAAIVELAHNLGLKSIAEWVEDVATLELLAEIGIDYVQGFLLARPQSPDNILAAASSASFIATPEAQAFVQRLPLRPRRIDALYEEMPWTGKTVH